MSKHSQEAYLAAIEAGKPLPAAAFQRCNPLPTEPQILHNFIIYTKPKNEELPKAPTYFLKKIIHHVQTIGNNNVYKPIPSGEPVWLPNSIALLKPKEKHIKPVG